MKTFIPGKDAALEDSIQFFLTQLQKCNLQIKEVSWLNPVPNVWSVHIQHIDCPLCFSNGKGASKKAALASALGEYFERLATNYYFSDFHLGKRIAEGKFVHYPDEKWFPSTVTNLRDTDLLTPKLWNFYDPDHRLLPGELIDMESCNIERGICALPFKHYSSNKTVYVPVNLITNLYASNGMASGNSKYEARVQALSEILERYVKNKIISEAISLPTIPSEVLCSYPAVASAIDQLTKAGFPLFCFDASLNGKYPVICVALFNPKNGGCFVSFGSHPQFGIALERTVTELLQGRGLADLGDFSSPTFDNSEVADLTNLETHFIDSSGLISWDLFQSQSDYDFVNWHFDGNTEEEYQNLVRIIEQDAIDILIRDYDHLGVYVCRILAVGMSEIYPPDDLLLANNNLGLPLRETIQRLPQSAYRAAEYLKLIQQLDDHGIDDFTRVRELLGLAPSKDSAWYTLRIGELKAMLSLAGGDLRQAQIWIDWTLQCNASTFSAERLMNYHCLQTLSAFALSRADKGIESYRAAFDKMYGQQRVDRLWQVILGIRRFEGLTAIDSNLSQLHPHQSLLAVHDKLNYWADHAYLKTTLPTG